jgi:hypothetical protein
MLEDDLRNFPMATTDYLQRIQATQRYQDIIAVHALFEVIQRAILGQLIYSVPLDWLEYRLHVNIFDLTRLTWATKMAWHQYGCPLFFTRIMGDRPGVINIKSVHAITPGQSPDRSILIDLVRCLRRLAAFETVYSVPHQVSITTLRKISLLLTPFLGLCQISRA